MFNINIPYRDLLSNHQVRLLLALYDNIFEMDRTSEMPRADRDLFLAAARNNEAALEFVSPERRADYREFLLGVFVQPKVPISCLPSDLIKDVQAYLGVRLPIVGQSAARPSSQRAGSIAQPRDPFAAAEGDVRITNTLQ